MSLLLAIALVASGAAGAVTYEPASPTVGDLVTITFPDPGEGKVSVLPSEEFEVVEVSGDKAVVRSFRPGITTLTAEILTPGRQTERYSLEIEIRSVLAENDDLRPAPLVLPKALPPNSVARWTIAGSAGAALVVWMILFFVAKRLPGSESEDETGAIDPAAAYLERLNRIGRIEDEEERWRQLADSTRWLLPRIDRSYGPELTTSEIVALMRERRVDAVTLELVDRILHGGDWAKFSPFGAPDDTSAAVIARARDLATMATREEAA